MDIPLLLLGIPYAILLGIHIVMSVVNIANLYRYGSGDMHASFVVLVYLCYVAVILLFSSLLLSNVDWRSSFHISLPSSTIGS